MHPTNSQILYVPHYNGIYKTTDGGLSWTETAYDAGANFSDIEFKPNSNNKMYASSKRGVYVSTNKGNTWTLSSGMEVHSTVDRIELAVTMDNPNYLYAVHDASWAFGGDYGFQGLFLSTDGGTTFSRKSNTPNIMGWEIDGQGARDQAHFNLAISVSPTNSDEVYVGATDVWKSTDKGVTWSNKAHHDIEIAGEDHYVHSDIHALEWDAAGNLYCGSDGGIYVSANNADTWSNRSFGLQITQAYKIGLGSQDPTASLASVYYGAQDNGLNGIDLNTEEAIQWFGADGMETALLTNPKYLLGAIQKGYLFIKNLETGVVEEITPTEVLDYGGAWVTPFKTFDPGYTSQRNSIIIGYEDIFKSQYLLRGWYNADRMVQSNKWGLTRWLLCSH